MLLSGKDDVHTRSVMSICYLLHVLLTNIGEVYYGEKLRTTDEVYLKRLRGITHLAFLWKSLRNDTLLIARPLV